MFESTLRAEVLGILSFDPKPQVTIQGPGWSVRPDLVDVRLGVVLEADSFEWHGDRAALSADARKVRPDGGRRMARAPVLATST